MTGDEFLPTPEETARRAEGGGTPDELEAWRTRLLASREARNEFEAVARAIREDHGQAPEYLVQRHMRRLRPETGIWVGIRDKAVELFSAPGWRTHPAMGFRGEEASPILSLSRKCESLLVDVQVERVHEKAVDLQISVKDPLQAEVPTLKVSILSEGRLLHSQYLEGNRAVFRELGHGEYTVQIGQSRNAILTLELRVSS